MAVDLSNYKSSLSRVSINPSSSFLSGVSTSLFGTGKVLVGSVVDPFLPDVSALPDTQQLISEISTKLISHVTTYASSYVSAKMSGLLIPPSPADITSRIMSYMNAYLDGTGDVLKKLMSSQESQTKKKSSGNNQKVLSTVQKQVTKYVGIAQEKISYLIENNAKGWMADVATYISQGPTWVQSQVDMIDDYCCEQVAQYIGEQAKKLQDMKDDIINNLIESEAKREAEIINEETYDKLSQKLKKVEQKKAGSTNATKAAAKAAILAIKAQLGL